MRTCLHIVVVSYDGWSWLLAWDQFGMDEICVCPMTELARKQLEEIQVVMSSVIRICDFKQADLCQPSNKKIIYSIHFESLKSIDLADNYVLKELASDRNREAKWIISMAGSHILQMKLKHAIGSNFQWQTLRHSKLGGLTSARLTIGWRGIGTDVFPGQVSYPLRPLHRFLEPAAKHVQWRKAGDHKTDCWYPHSEDVKPYPWPWSKSPIWVETFSVYTKGFIQRLFTDKERCQLMDLHPKWKSCIDLIWNWNDGACPPLRLMIETIVSMRAPLLENEASNNTWNKDEIKNVDWGRNRAPWLGTPGTLDTTVPLERLLYFGWVWDPKEALNIAVACRRDDAEVDLQLWAIGGNADGMEAARQTIRNVLWKWWLKRICREGRRWVAQQIVSSSEKERNLLALMDCLTRCLNSTWWNWDHGSRLFFWRWPQVWRDEARDGAMGFHTSFPRPRLHFPQVPIQEEWIKEKDKEKLEKLLRRGYIHVGVCKTTVPRFPVPKGTDDIRVVWDLSKNGLNGTMYTPTFFLATMSTYLRRIESGFYGGDFDVGEQFHNYMLHEGEQPYCGVEIPVDLREKLSKEGLHVPKFMRWSRLVFGWQSSPYLALRMFARALEVAKGDPHDTTNIFGWTRVRLNLPGMIDYDPGRPRVMKEATDGSLACDCVTFYDDGRVFGSTKEKAEKALRQITAGIQYLGNQDAARKRRPVSQTPGAWAGGVAYTDQNMLRIFVSQEKWDRTKEFLHWVQDCINQPEPQLERKRFQSGKGFLVHISMCYDFMQPYMKGFHLSENSWRANRDEEGWKIPAPHEEGEDDPLSGYLPDNEFPIHDAYEPPMVIPVPRLRDDIEALLMFFEPTTPVQIIARPVQGTCLVAYGGGDASGEGFGGQIKPVGDKARLRRGFWCPAKADESSNWRELRNLVDIIHEEAVSGRLVGQEIWLATDNTTAAYAFHNGTSTSRSLHEMVIELRMCALRGNFALHLYHISGTRMIESGIDGLSRGELQVEAIEHSTATLMPLHLSPTQRSPELEQWLRLWLDDSFRIATPDQWFHEAQHSGEYTPGEPGTTWVWDLPPAAAIHALEELGNGRLKRHNVMRGVVLIPHLLTYEWSRRFSRIVDLYFHIPPGSIPAWPDNMHEPLTVGFYLPLFRHQPWDWKQVPFVASFGSALSSMHKTRDPSVRDILRKFWCTSIGVATMPKGLVRNVLQGRSWKRFLDLSTDG